MTPEQLLEILAVVLALLFAYFPKLKDWFDQQELGVKLFVQSGLIAVVVGVLFGLSCATLFYYFTCDWSGGWDAFVLFIKAILLNQGMYQVGVRLVRKFKGQE